MVNYGIVYGLSAYGLADRLQIEQDEAQEFIDRYLERFPAVAQFMADAVTQAEEHGYVSTLFGRRRQIPEIRARNWQTRKLGERLAVNCVIQGTAADIIKVAMVRSHDALRDAGLQTRCILQIHDELLFEGPTEEAEQRDRDRAPRDGRRRRDGPAARGRVRRRPELAGREVVDRGLAVVLTAVVGGMVALQGPINSSLGKTIGTFQAAFFSFATGTIILAVIARARARRLRPDRRGRDARAAVPDRRRARRLLRLDRPRDRAHARRRRHRRRLDRRPADDVGDHRPVRAPRPRQGPDQRDEGDRRAAARRRARCWWCGGRVTRMATDHDSHPQQLRGRPLDRVRSPPSCSTSPTPPPTRSSRASRSRRAAELDAAVAAARAALPAWRAVAVPERARRLFALREKLVARQEELARSVTMEMGKTLPDARAEVGRMIEMVEAACAVPTTMQGRIIEDVARNVDAETVRQPVGVCAAIVPFNFPAMVPFWFLPFAIACGNTFVLKPSEQVPITQSLVFESLDELDLPDGVVNLVNGDRGIADAILDHPDIDAVSFVGSAKVARHVYARAAARGKRVQALGGAKNHMVVMPDAVLDKTVERHPRLRVRRRRPALHGRLGGRRGRRRPRAAARRAARGRRGHEGRRRARGGRRRRPADLARRLRAGARLRRPRGGRGRRDRARRPRRAGGLRRPDDRRRRDARDGDLARRGVRPRAGDGPRRVARRRDRRGQLAAPTATASRSSPSPAPRSGASATTSRSG